MSLQFVGTLLVSLSGTQALFEHSCQKPADCAGLCQGGSGGCVNGHCVCDTPKVELQSTKTLKCKRDSDCPDAKECHDPEYYYACLHGECICIAV
ncbi:unnamed protein product [Microthlaspi erraticum]|uniref:Defensin-like protein n=1 Tax=Microthlaspi erraticum TaxID=1685480 RepID=A0A6D2J2G9_9BRAS|nr:unnamed protein product [Microthlaspi erraticum]